MFISKDTVGAYAFIQEIIYVAVVLKQPPLSMKRNDTLRFDPGTETK